MPPGTREEERPRWTENASGGRKIPRADGGTEQTKKSTPISQKFVNALVRPVER